ncbi:hypothetical protein [Aliarcobacter trophiarum]|uniref:hypothetical protein n=1 Tax=Aliarcobacter trophiarum TaxID=708186 RepID=UPI00100A9813|nr:hypothetical protein [Aliarcobacter trophiarum]RXI25064.1 hypothetical protein CRU89_09650 [Aliarcobacter trophiarum]
MKEIEQIKKILEADFEEFAELDCWIHLGLDEYFNKDFVRFEKQCIFSEIKDKAREIVRLQKKVEEIKLNLIHNKLNEECNKIAKEYNVDLFEDLEKIKGEEERKKIRDRVIEKRKEFEKNTTFKEIEKSCKDDLEDIQILIKLSSKGYKIEITDLPRFSNLKSSGLLQVGCFNMVKESIKTNIKNVKQYKDIKENLLISISDRLSTLLPLGREKIKEDIKEQQSEINEKLKNMKQNFKEDFNLVNKLDELKNELDDMDKCKIAHRQKANDFLNEIGLGLTEVELNNTSQNKTNFYKQRKKTKEHKDMEDFLKSGVCFKVNSLNE